MPTIRICVICNKSENETKFSHSTRKKCNKCNSKECNRKTLERDPAYFRTKMKENYKPRDKPVGRPKKNLE